MRKHFLILMLLSLLPLVGWAAPISETDIKAESPLFGYLPNIVGTGLIKDTHFEVVAYYTDGTMTTEVSAANVKKTDAGTDLVVLVRGLGTYEGTVKLTFQIKKNPLKITGTQKSKVYGKTEPTGDDFFTVTAITDGNDNNVLATMKPKITFSRAADKSPVAVGTYDYVGTITDAALAKNYSIASEDITTDGTTQAKFSITAKPFTAANISIDDITAIMTYSGDAYKPAVTVKDNTLAATPTTLALGQDYTVVYTENINAGTNTGVATVTGKGNYSGASIVKNFSIDQAPLIVTPVLEKDYDGTTTLPATEAATSFTYQGWKKNDSKALVTACPANSALTVTSAAIYADTYELTINNAGDFTITGNNYKVLPQKGTFTIKPIDLAIAVTSETKAYGVAPTKAITKTGTTKVIAGTDDWELIQAVVEVTVAETPEASGTNKGKYKMTPAAKANPYNATTQAVEYNTFEAKLKTLNSYKVTWTPGYLAITKAPLYVGLDETKYTTLSKIYDGKQVEVAAPTKAQLLVTGLLNDDTADKVIKIDGALGITVENNAAKVGKYNITVTGVTADNYEIVPITSQYEITQKALKVTVYDQTFVKDKALNLNTTLFDVEGLASTDEADEVIKLTTTVPTSGDPAVISSIGVYQINAVDVGTAKSKYANYAVTVKNSDGTKTYGTATVVAAGALTIDDSKDMKAALAAANGTDQTITFSARSLTADSWNVMVLPFNTTVSEVSRALGYAVIDVLDETATDGNVHFNIHLGEIKANTPFMFKVDGEKNNLNQVVVLSKEIVYDADNADADAVKIDADGNPYVADKAGNKLVGFYGINNAVAAGEYYLGKEDGKVTWKPAGATGATVKNGERAKLVMASGSEARQIIIEEPDGTVTAISAINVDNVVNAKGSWYTLSGMKLEGQPTEKGVYINNGKKVVIK